MRTSSGVGSALAVVKGAYAVENHFRVHSADGGPDSRFSILPKQLEGFSDSCEWFVHGIKSAQLKRNNSELENKKFA